MLGCVYSYRAVADGAFVCCSPWVNNCVGIGNQKAFLLMLLYVTATSVQAALLVLMQYIMCSRGKYSCGLQNDQFPGKLGGWILAAAAVFGLFARSCWPWSCTIYIRTHCSR